MAEPSLIEPAYYVKTSTAYVKLRAEFYGRETPLEVFVDMEGDRVASVLQVWAYTLHEGKVDISGIFDCIQKDELVADCQEALDKERKNDY